MGRGKSQYQAILRARVPQGFKERLEAILSHRGHGDSSDLIREAVLRYIEDEERRMSLEEHSGKAPPNAETKRRDIRYSELKVRSKGVRK